LILTLGPLIGIGHLLDTPIWPGLKVVGAFAGVVAAAGFLLLIRVLWKGQMAGASQLLFFSGLFGLGIAVVQGITLMFPPVYTTFHYTSNTTAHAHLALGSILMIVLAAGLSGSSVLSKRKFSGLQHALAGSGFFIAGILLLFIFQTSAGVLQATAFINGLNITDWLPMFRWLQLGVLAGGLLAFLGILGIGLTLAVNLSGSASAAADKGGNG